MAGNYCVTWSSELVTNNPCLLVFTLLSNPLPVSGLDLVKYKQKTAKLTDATAKIRLLKDSSFHLAHTLLPCHELRIEWLT